MGVKELYYSWEDKWYAFLDRLQEKGMPVYAIIDPIDKIIPSLLLFLALIVLVVAGISWVYFLQPGITGPGIAEGKTVSLEILVVDSSNNPLSDALVELSGEGIEERERTDGEGKVLFNVPLNSTVIAIVSMEGYISESREYSIESLDEEDNSKKISLEEKEQSYFTSFVFTSPNGRKLAGTRISAVFSCSNYDAEFYEPRQEITEGEIELEVPEGCGNVLVDVSTDNAEYENKKYSSNGGMIRLEAKTNESAKGVLTAIVFSSAGPAIHSIQITVKSGNEVFGPKLTNKTGEAQFELPYGSYRVFADDPLEKYASKIDSIEIDSSSKTMQIQLEKDPFGKINLTAIDSVLNQPVAAKFFVRKGTDIFELDSTAGNTAVSFIAEEAGVFYVRAAKEDYLSSDETAVELKTKGQEENISIKLNHCSPETCAPLKVKVIDEDGMAVENAAVNLHDANSGFIKEEFEQRSTDTNGYAKPEYALVENGKYFASAIKFPAMGQSSDFEIKEGQKLEITIEIRIGKTKVNLVAADEFGQAIPFADVELIASSGEELGLLKTDEKGMLSYELKADKEIYVRVSKEEFTPWTSELIQLMPDVPVNLNAMLNEEVLGDTPKIKFLGLFEKNTETVIDAPEPAKTYDAKFELTVPSGKNFESVGMHLRTGLSEMIEKDYLFISKINAPNTSIIKGTTYDETASQDDEKNITNGAAKWANVVWRSPEAGKYIVVAEIKVLPSTPPLTPLALYFRAWGEKEKKFYRDPTDDMLGLGKASDAKKGFYANTYSKIYFEQEMQEACPDEFCFFKQMLDLDEDVFLIEPYNLRVSDDYNLAFNLINNTGELHNNANLRIKVMDEPPKEGEGIRIESYKIFNSDLLVSESQTPAFEVPRIDLGNWASGKSVTGTLMLNAKKEGKTFVLFEIVSEQNLVFTQFVELNNYFEYEQELSSAPEVIPAFSQTMLDINSVYKNGKDKGKPVVDATILVERETSTYSKTSFTTKTDSRGKASVMIPASSPGTKITITSSKPKVKTEKKELIVSGQVLEIIPAQISVQLNTSTKTEEKTVLELKNTINQLQKINSITATGKTKGLLDALKMENFHNQFANTKISSLDSAEISALISLSSDAMDLTRNESLKGKLIIETVSGSGLTTWVSEVPFDVSIEAKNEAKEKGCLTITPKEWKESLYNDSSEMQIEIFNNCLDSAGNPLELKDVSAKISWTSNPLGLVELTLANAEEGMEASQVLVNGRRMVFFDELPGESYLNGYLKFTSLQGNTGKTAKFSVEINGEMLAGENKYEFVGADGAVNAEIKLIDLKQCIQFSPNPEMGIELLPEEDEKTFSIDSSACGDLSIDFRFCDRGKDKCRAQATQGGIELQPWELKNVRMTAGDGASNNSNSGNSDSNSGSGSSSGGKQVLVKRTDIPGIYGIRIEARPAGGSYRQVAEMLAVVKAKPNKFFDLERYSYSLIGEGTQDETALFNRKFLEDVQVKANLCNWKDAIDRENNKPQALITSVGAGMGAAYLAWTAIGSSIAAGTALTLPSGATIAVGGSALGAGAVTFGVGIVVAVVVYAIIAHQTKWSNYCQDHYHTGILPDFVVNLTGLPNNEDYYLPPDLISLKLDFEGIAVNMNPLVVDEYTDLTTNKRLQQVGLVYTNESIANPEPLYGLLEIKTKEHVHGDDTHSESTTDEFDVFCRNENFGSRWVGKNDAQGLCENAYDTEKTELFHVRFETDIPEEEIPPVSYDEFDCVSGIRRGKTGEEYLPKVKLNWEWGEEGNVEGITKNSCDAGNDKAVYCDSTQFTIELMYKLKALYEFLKENNFDLGCPEQADSLQAGIDNYNAEFSFHEVEANKAGLASVESTVSGTDVEMKIKVQNNSSTARTIPVQVSFGKTLDSESNMDSEPAVQECNQSATVNAGGETAEVTCSFANLDDGVYSATLTPASNEDWVDTFMLMNNVKVGDVETAQDRADANSQSGCWLMKTTETYFGRPVILDFVQNNPGIKWTDEVQNIADLQKLIKFQSYLMADGYSKDFKEDFTNYFTEQHFVTTPIWFSALENIGGKDAGFADYLKNDELFKVTKKYSTGAEQLSSAGVYTVELAEYFTGKGWHLFDEETAEPSGFIAIVLYKSLDAVPNSPFYSMPLDGFVGVEGDGYSRQGYGTAFVNENAEERIVVTNDFTPLETFSDHGSNPIKFVNAKKNNSIKSLNSSLGSRGTVLTVKNKKDKGEIIFSPSIATPVLMKVTEETVSDDAVAAYYSISSSGLGSESGAVMNYWTGAGRCLDFTGVPVFEAFNYSPDRKASNEDATNNSNWQSSYAVDWPYAEFTGDVYLRTIFYTPEKDNSALKAESGNVEFISSSGEGKEISLNGTTNDSINSMQTVFELVKSRDLCITSSGNAATFWWNPRKAFIESGIHDRTAELDVDNGNCIGFKEQSKNAGIPASNDPEDANATSQP